MSFLLVEWQILKARKHIRPSQLCLETLGNPRLASAQVTKYTKFMISNQNTLISGPPQLSWQLCLETLGNPRLASAQVTLSWLHLVGGVLEPPWGDTKWDLRHLTCLAAALCAPYLTLLCLAPPYLTLPYLTLPYLAPPYLTLPYLTLPYLTIPYITLHYLALPYIALPLLAATLCAPTALLLTLSAQYFCCFARFQPPCCYYVEKLHSVK